MSKHVAPLGIREGLKALARPGVAYRLVAPPAPVTHLAAVHRAGDLAPTVAAFVGVVRDLWPQRSPDTALRHDRRPGIIRS